MGFVSELGTDTFFLSSVCVVLKSWAYVLILEPERTGSGLD